MSSNYDFKISKNDKVELDTIIKKSDKPKDPVGTIKYEGSESTNHNLEAFQTGTVIFNPQESGSYTIPVNGQKLRIKVTNPKTIPDSVLTEDLVAWYRFEDNDARDYASNNEYPNTDWGDSTAYNGTINGATYNSKGGVTDFESGSNSGEFEFNGDDVIGLNNSLVDAGKNYTVSLWLKTNNTNTDPLRNIAFSSGHTFDHDDLSINGTIVGYFDGNRGGVTVNADDGNYHHLCCTNDSGTHKVYKDSSFIGSYTNSLSSDNGVQNSIGARYSDGSPTNHYNGVVDDIRIYNRVLTSSEISDIYNSTEL